MMTLRLIYGHHIIAAYKRGNNRYLEKKCFPCNKSPTTPSNKFANDELMQVVFYLQGTFIPKDSCGTIALMVFMMLFYSSAPMKKTL